MEEYAQNQPSVLWNAMVYPFLHFSIKGSIWYQGKFYVFSVSNECAIYQLELS